MILTGKTHAPARGWVREDQGTGGESRRVLRAGALSERWADRIGDGVMMASVTVLAAAAVAAFAVAAPLILAGSALVGLVAQGGAPKAWRPVRVHNARIR